MKHRRTLQAVALLALLGLVLLLAADVRAQAPAAGTSIGNQATATYTDGSGTTRAVTSNVVSTVVQQVASLTLAQNNTKYSTAGGLVYFPHILTNTGNGTDTFPLAIVQSGADNYNFTGLAIYPDADGDGLPDAGAAAITTTGAVPAGGIFSFVIVGTAVGPTGNGVLDVTATSTFDNTKTATNTDTATVTTNAVIPVNKSVSQPSGTSAGGPYTYTLSYTNTGNATATNLTLTDAIPAGLTYVAGSGRWSVSGATALTDAAAGDPAGIAYDYNVTTAGTVTAVIASVPAGASGTVTFNFTVNAATGAGTVYNQANVAYNDGSGTTINGTSNKVPFQVSTTAAVDIAGDTVANVPQGGTATFTNVVTNNGNQTDTFDITLSGSTFPAGTTFVLFQADGSTPLLDTNSSGYPDTGPLAPGATYNVILKATLPGGYSGPTDLVVNKTATSKNDPNVSDTAPDTLQDVLANTVDLTNNVSIAGGAGAADGLGAGPEANPITTISVNPGATATFVLYVNNTSAVADAYALEASTDNTFAALNLPAGWSVQFLDDNGTVITNTGLIATGANMRVRAVVTTSAAALAGNVELYFRVRSPNTGVLDRKHDRVTINTIRSLTVTPNNTGQVYPGGSVVYSHTIRNTGNVLEGDNTVSTVALALADSLAGWTSVIYWDRDNNGVLDPTDPVVTNLSTLVGGTNGASTAAGLSPGEGATLFVKVYAPPGATVGSVDATTLTATTANGTYTTPVPAVATATDTTSVISGDLSLDKAQALDANGDGTPETGYSTNVITAGAVPGACIRYRLTVTNTGTANATSVVVSDVTPAYTVYDNGDGTTTATGVAVMTKDGGATFTAIVAPTDGSSGNVTANVGVLTPGQTAVIYFGVRIRQ